MLLDFIAYQSELRNMVFHIQIKKKFLGALLFNACLMERKLIKWKAICTGNKVLIFCVVFVEHLTQLMIGTGKEFTKYK